VALSLPLNVLLSLFFSISFIFIQLEKMSHVQAD